MRNTLKKEDYLTPETLALKKELASREKQDREYALAQKLVDKIPLQRKQYVLEILSRELATK